MGQKLSTQPSTPLVWILRGQPKLHPNPEQPIKFQYKTRRKSPATNTKSTHIYNQSNQQQQQQSSPTDNESSSQSDTESGDNTRMKIVLSNAFIFTEDVGERNNKSLNNSRKYATSIKSDLELNNLNRRNTNQDKFGYEIEDIDLFLEKASIEKPANIPVVLSVPSVLYQTRVGGYQAEVALPLGMVVNAVFRNQHWLYAQTPHGEEGYIAYTACIPLGIIPASSFGTEDDNLQPCWETSADVFPRPSGNILSADTEKLSECSSSEEVRKFANRRRHRRRSSGINSSRNGVWSGQQGAASVCGGERSVDRLYMRASNSTCSEMGIGKRHSFKQRHTLLIIGENYAGAGQHTIKVQRGDVVTLLSTHLNGWFWVRGNAGEEGFIPAAVAGYGYL